MTALSPGSVRIRGSGTHTIDNTTGTQEELDSTDARENVYSRLTHQIICTEAQEKLSA